MDAPEEEGFIMSLKSVVDPSTQLVFLGKWIDLLNRVVGGFWPCASAFGQQDAPAAKGHAILRGF